MKLQPVTSVLLVLMLLAAGCAGQEASPQAGSSSTSSSDAGAAPVAEGQGRVEGSVTDDELVPIVGARVRLTYLNGTDLPGYSTTTAEGGLFSIPLIPPGDFLVKANMTRYRDAKPFAARITYDEVIQVKLILPSLALIEPHHVTVSARFFFQYQACVFAQGAIVRCSTGYSVANTSKALEVQETTSGILQAFVAEMAWTPTISVCAQTMRFDLFGPQHKSGRDVDTIDTLPPNPHHWTNVPNQVRNPVRVLVPRDGTEPVAMHSAYRTDLNAGTPIPLSGTWRIYPWTHRIGGVGTPVDAYCVVQQALDYYLSAFFVDPPADGFSVARP